MSFTSTLADVVGLGPPSVSARLSEFDLEKLGCWRIDHFTEKGEHWALGAFATAIGERKWEGRTHADRSRAQLIDDIERRVRKADKSCTARRHSRWTACPHQLQVEEEISKGLYEDDEDLERIKVVGNGLIRHHWFEQDTQAASLPPETSTKAATVDSNQQQTDPSPYDQQLGAAGVAFGAELGKVLARGYLKLDDMSKGFSGSSSKDW